MNIDKDKKKFKNQFCCWQDDRIHANQSLYLHYGPLKKVNSVFQNQNPWIKIRTVIVENENKFKQNNF